MAVVKFAKTGTAPEDTSWSWDAASQNAILGDGDDWGKYQAAHTWYDSSNTGVKAGYKLPHHRAGSDGTLEAVWHGVTAAMARLSSADIPDADMKGAFDHLAGHYAQWEKTPPEWDRLLAQVQARKAANAHRSPLPAGATRASINVLADRPNGTPTDKDMALINAMAQRDLSPDQVFVWGNEISSEAVDAYFTQMTPWSLEQFANDATEGRAVCDSHQHMQLNIGRSYFGITTIATREGKSVLTCQSMAYMLRGMGLAGGMRSDDIIAGIQGGIYRDISIGFIPLHYWCSICGCDMLRTMECNHWPGQTYQVKGNGNTTSEVLCIALVDSRLAEYSIVYDGATPNAMILKAQREMELGRAPARMISYVEDVTRTSLRARYAGFTPLAAPAPAPKTVNAKEPASMANPKPLADPQDLAMFARLIGAVQTRGGKQLSKPNLDRLQAMHDKLSAGHATMDEAMGELADFMAEKRDGDNDPDDMRGATAASRKATTKTGKKQKASNTDGTDKPPADDDGDGAADDDKDAEDETGEDTDGEDKADDKDPAPPKGKKRADKDPNPPETDDGDGDDDDLPEMEEADEGDHDEGSPKSKSGKSAKRAGPTAEERALIEIGVQARNQAIEAVLQAGVRARGAAFNAEAYRAMMERATYPQIVAMAQDFDQMARAALSPIGRFNPDATLAGGGFYDNVPTLVGGPQTMPRNPADPAGTGAVTPITRANKGKPKRRNPSDPALYKA